MLKKFLINVPNQNCIQEIVNIKIYRTMNRCFVRASHFVSLREEHGLNVFENRVLRKIELKNILGQRVMATKESQCLTKQYVMKTYGGEGWRYISFI